MWRSQHPSSKKIHRRECNKCPLISVTGLTCKNKLLDSNVFWLSKFNVFKSVTLKTMFRSCYSPWKKCACPWIRTRYHRKHSSVEHYGHHIRQQSQTSVSQETTLLNCSSSSPCFSAKTLKQCSKPLYHSMKCWLV